jgi:hypothetical protein
MVYFVTLKIIDSVFFKTDIQSVMSIAENAYASN